MPGKKRTNRQIFFDTLDELSGHGERLISNQALRDKLKWDNDKYKRMKAQLRDEGLVISARGPGGSVGLSAEKELKVFVSYSHVDEKLKDELVKHLVPLGRLYGIKTWHDRKIAAGDDWKKSIDNELNSADIVLLLVSIDFINSQYCYDVELEAAMERNARGETVVVPIILRSCMWQHTPFAKLQALPRDAKAVTSWPNPDEAFADVAEGLRKRFEELNE